MHQVGPEKTAESVFHAEMSSSQICVQLVAKELNRRHC